MSESTKGGNIILRSLSVPDDVEPGETFRAEAEVSNGAAYINPWDPDKCGLAPPGYKLEVVFEGPGGQSVVKGPACQPTTEVGTNDETYSATFTAPTAGRARVEVFVRLPGSGKRTQAIDASASVSEGEPAAPDYPGDDGDRGDGGDGGGSSSGPNIEGSAKWVAVAFVALALAWGADSAEGIVS